MMLPSRSRVMTLYPQFFDRYKALLLQPLVGQSEMGGKSVGHGPRTIAIQTGSYGSAEFGTEFEQVANLGAASAPQFPVA